MAMSDAQKRAILAKVTRENADDVDLGTATNLRHLEEMGRGERKPFDNRDED